MSENIRELNFEEFKQLISTEKLPVLVDFWAPWCGPCRMQAPILEELAEELSGKAVIAKVNVDENGDLAGEYGVSSIPTLLIFSDGKAVEKKVGLSTKDALSDMLLKHSKG